MTCCLRNEGFFDFRARGCGMKASSFRVSVSGNGLRGRGVR